jgi:DNA-binding NtrC family response regulator
MKKQVLIVDDYSEMRNLISLLLLSQFQCRIFEASSGEEASQRLQQEKIDYTISDFEMHHGSGLWLYHHMKNHHPQVPLILVTSVFDKLTLKPDNTLRAILSKDQVAQLPRLLRQIQLES